MKESPTEEKISGYNLRLPEDLKKKIKHMAVDHGTTFLEEVISALMYWVKIGGEPEYEDRLPKRHSTEGREKSSH